MLKQIKTFIKDENGAAAVEYGLIAALIAVVIILGVRTLGTNLSNTFSAVNSGITN